MLQHSEIVGPGAIAPLLAERGMHAKLVRLFAGDPPPVLSEFDWLIILGGLMGVHDEAEYPWLAKEKVLIASAAQSGKKILGVCLGAQLLADVLGGSVTRADHAEVGWHEVSLQPKARTSKFFNSTPQGFEAFMWHQDIFTPPPGASSLMRSSACAHQAFEIDGRIAAVQFHPEITESMARAWYRTHPPGHGPFIHQLPQDQGAFRRFEEPSFLRELLKGFAGAA